MPFLSPRERETLRVLCDTFVPRLVAGAGDDQSLSAFSAADVEVAAALEQTVEGFADEDGRRRFRRTLAVVNSRLANGLMTGLWDRFSQLSLEERTGLLERWGNSRFGSVRSSIQALKRMAMFLAYASRDAQESNPAWSVLGYKAAARTGESPSWRPIRPLEVSGPTTLDADVVIVGSGAGGAVVANELSGAGLDVLVVEKGEYYADEEFPGTELDGMRALYERRGMLATADQSFLVLAGSTLGGGTTVNWMTSLRPPQYVLEEWAGEFGFTAATSSEFQRSLTAVCERLKVSTGESRPNGPNVALDRGCRALGYRCSVVPRNASGCEQCDFCGFGCRYGAKQDARKTFLKDAFDRGARILTRANVHHVLHSGSRAAGVQVSVRDPNGRVHDLAARCRAVVVAAGSIHTPAILMRSGLGNRHIGANLHLHPTTAVFARYDEPVRPWQGVPQARMCDEFADLDRRGYGVRLEVAPAHPGISALALPWQSGRDHKRLMQQLPLLGNVIILTRDRHTGSVRLNRHGNPIIHYWLHPGDAGHMMRGVVEALKVQRAAGAAEVFSPHARVLSHRADGGTGFDDFLREVRRRGVRPGSLGLYSAHQLSTCRIADSRSRGALNPEGQSYELDNLFVADGSVLPNACGVNPMITIMGLAHHIAQQIKNRMS